MRPATLDMSARPRRMSRLRGFLRFVYGCGQDRERVGLTCVEPASELRAVAEPSGEVVGRSLDRETRLRAGPARFVPRCPGRAEDIRYDNCVRQRDEPTND